LCGKYGGGCVLLVELSQGKLFTFAAKQLARWLLILA
jgi:hypothetical protein